MHPKKKLPKKKKKERAGGIILKAFSLQTLCLNRALMQRVQVNKDTQAYVRLKKQANRKECVLLGHGSAGLGIFLTTFTFNNDIKCKLRFFANR